MEEHSLETFQQACALPVALRARFFQKQDREAIRRICADTGFLGHPIDPVFEDRELFADYLTRYYTDWEPESTLVCERDGQVVGYLTGCRKPIRRFLFHLLYNPYLFFRAFYRWWAWPYRSSTRRYLRWVLCKGWREVPYAPRGVPHFHINLLPQARNVASTRALIDKFLAYLVASGEKSVYGQVVTWGDRRSEKLFLRYGFRVLDRRELTKYRAYVKSPVFLCTVWKDLAKNPRLYGSCSHRRPTTAGAQP
ncbi:GNAT family N-acetyltransferase [Candidatus Methylacidithermus pantelleriae]|uniref:Acetyltransferase, GNAT family n=1 Tax=Candidatus Methylacidithermus pantelleriae TaxID=2744239 RepID=A0A8J2BMX3_9BACT|nr:GNAT family acetyltransferase [Candidatus Methylacidithermus pantelleriae]CAF0697449.1 Acetyltransferase, GNAT family [Candidatus Methylacidithermus pantelleriae]